MHFRNLASSSIYLLSALSFSVLSTDAKSRYQHEIRNGKIRANTRHPQRALPYYDRAIKLAPKNGRAYYERGLVYLKIEKQKLALADFNKAVVLGFKNPTLFFMRSRVFYETGDKQAAIRDLGRYIKLAPSDETRSEGYRNRAKMYRNLGQEDKAIADLNKAISYNQHSSNYWNRGNIYYKRKQYKKAVADYTKAIELEKSDDLVRFYSLRAKAYDKLGKKKLAEKDRQVVKEQVKDTWGSFMLDDVGDNKK